MELGDLANNESAYFMQFEGKNPIIKCYDALRKKDFNRFYRGNSVIGGGKVFRKDKDSKVVFYFGEFSLWDKFFNSKINKKALEDYFLDKINWEYEVH